MEKYTLLLREKGTKKLKEVEEIYETSLHSAIGYFFTNILNDSSLNTNNLLIRSSEKKESVKIKPFNEYDCKEIYEIRYKILEDAGYIPDFEFRETADGLFITGASNCKDVMEIPRIVNYSGKKQEIIGIDSFSFVGENFEKAIIAKSIKYLEDNAFVGCDNLKEVRLLGLPEGTINLDNVFKKDVSNILFLVYSDETRTSYKTNLNILMTYKNIFKLEGIEVKTINRKTPLELTIKKLPDVEELYIPDVYEGKIVDMTEYSEGCFGLRDAILTKIQIIRFPSKGPIKRIFCSPGNKTDVVFSPFSKEAHFPDYANKVFVYEGVKMITTGREVNIFPIDENLKNSLETIDVQNKESQPFINNMTKDKYGLKKENGILFEVDKYADSLNLPNDVYVMVDDLCRGNHLLSSVVFNDKIKIIPEECFMNCYKLKDITIPSQVKSIGYKAFMEENDPDDSSPTIECCKNVVFKGDKEKIEIASDAFRREEWLPFR